MFNHAKKAMLAAAMLGMLAPAAFADDAAKSTAKFGYAGYLDASYNYDGNAKNGNLGINQFGLDVNASDDAYGIKAMASLVHSTYVNTGAGVNVDYMSIDQAYADKSFFDGMLEAKIGRFYTLVGNEVVPAPKNANETYSLLFDAEPVKHDGLAITYSPLKSLSVSGWMANNVEQLYPAAAGFIVGNDTYSKDFGGQANYTLGSLNVIGNYYFEPVLSGQYDNAHLINGIASYKLNDTLSFAGEYLYRILLPNSTYKGAASIKDQGYSLYSTYTLGSFSVNPRFSQYFYPSGNYTFSVDNGSTYVDAPQVEQYTLDLKYAFGSLTAYVEGNVYTTPKGYDAFANGSSTAVGAKTNVLVGANYQF